MSKIENAFKREYASSPTFALLREGTATTLLSEQRLFELSKLSGILCG